VARVAPKDWHPKTKENYSPRESFRETLSLAVFLENHNLPSLVTLNNCCAPCSGPAHYAAGRRTLPWYESQISRLQEGLAEACEGGQQNGEVSALDMNQYNVVARFTQSEFDEMAEHFNDEEGHYPDT